VLTRLLNSYGLRNWASPCLRALPLGKDRFGRTIDEVQLLYKLGPDSSFWRAVKEVATTNLNECRVQLLLMGAYGLQGSSS